MFRLRTLGTFGLTDATAADASLPPHRLALLALLAATGDRGMARDKVLAYLWPESTPTKARAALEQMLHALRVSLDDRSALLGNPLRLDPAVVSSDVGEFRQAIAAGDLERVAALYEGPFLDGFYLSDVPEFEQWVTSERSRLEAQYVSAIEKLATQAAAAGDHARTSEWVRALGSVPPLSARAARRFIEAIAAAGDCDAASEFATLYGDRVRTELGVEPDPTVAALADQLRGGEAAPAKYAPPHRESTAQATSEPPTIVRHARFSVAVTAGVAVLALLGGWAWLNRSNGPRLDPNVIAVMPFRVNAADSSYNYLREGIIDLLNARLTGGRGLPRAVDSRTLLVSWRRAVGDRSELTEEESLTLARQLGAGRVLLGSLIVTSENQVLTASLRETASGREVMPHREQSVAGELRLVDRLTLAILARGTGRVAVEPPALSDSIDAVKEYLAGLSAKRGNRWAVAAHHYARALHVDTTFALAALRLYEVVAEGGYPPEAGPPISLAQAFELATSLRDRLSERDQLYLRALWGSHLHSDLVGFLAALEAAAHAAPDDSKVWLSWSMSLAFPGPIAFPDWHRRAVAVIDSTIVLDSTNAEAIQTRLFLALHSQDPTAIRLYSKLLESAASDGDDTDAWRWASAQAIGDSAAIGAMRKRFASWSDQSIWNALHLSFVEGYPLGDLEYALRSRIAQPTRAATPRARDLGWLFDILAARGRVRAAVALADSMTRDSAMRLPYAERVIRYSILEPGVGYDTAAKAAVRKVAALPLPEPDVACSYALSTCAARRSAFCLTHAWRALEGDSGGVRAAATTLRHNSEDTSAVGAAQRPRGAICPAMLEALVAHSTATVQPTTELVRVDSTLLRGLFWDRVAPTANVVLSRLQVSVQDYRGALASIRRRSRQVTDFHIPVWPATLRAEGRLAPILGDTAGAIRAYTHYLTLRDKPDPGAMANEVARVRAHLALLRQGATR